MKNSKYEVYIWQFTEIKRKTPYTGKEYTYPDYNMALYWEGNIFLIALYKLWQANRKAVGYVRLEWRK